MTRRRIVSVLFVAAVSMFILLNDLPINGLSLCVASVPRDDFYMVILGRGGGYPGKNATRSFINKTPHPVCIRFSTRRLSNRYSSIRFDPERLESSLRITRITLDARYGRWHLPLADWTPVQMFKDAIDTHNLTLELDQADLIVRGTGVDPYWTARFDFARLAQGIPPAKRMLAIGLWFVLIVSAGLLLLWMDKLWMLARTLSQRLHYSTRAVPECYTNSALWIMVAAASGIVVWFAWHRAFDHDEFEAIHSAWLVLQGKRIYLDFFQHHHPAFYFLLSPLIAVFGEQGSTSLYLRSVPLIALGLSAGGTFLMARRLGDRHSATLSLLFLLSSPLFIHSAIEIRPDVIYVPLSLFGFLLLIEGPTNKRNARLFTSGVLFGVAFLFLQKAAVAAIAAALVVLWRVVSRRDSPRQIAVWGAGMGVGVLPLAVWILTNDVWHQYWTFNWLVNIRFQGGFSLIDSLWSIGLRNPGLWLLAGVGVVFAGGYPRYSQYFQYRLIVILAAWFLLSIFLTPAPFNQYFLPLIPFIAILAGFALHKVSGANRFLSTVIAMLIVISPVLSFLSIDRQKQTKQLAQVDYVLAHTDRSDIVYDGNAYFNLFRPDIDFFWFSVAGRGALTTVQSFSDYPYDIEKLIREKKPRIVSTFNLNRSQRARLTDTYTVSHQYPDLLMLNKLP